MPFYLSSAKPHHGCPPLLPPLRPRPFDSVLQLVERLLPGAQVSATWPQRMSAAIPLGFFAPVWFGSAGCAAEFAHAAFLAGGSLGGSSWGTVEDRDRVVAVGSEPFDPPLAARSVASSPILGLAKLALS